MTKEIKIALLILFGMCAVSICIIVPYMIVITEDVVSESTMVQSSTIDYQKVFNMYVNVIRSIGYSNSSNSNTVRIMNLSAMAEIRGFLEIVDGTDLKNLHLDTFYNISVDPELRKQINWLKCGY